MNSSNAAFPSSQALVLLNLISNVQYSVMGLTLKSPTATARRLYPASSCPLTWYPVPESHLCCLYRGTFQNSPLAANIPCLTH